MYLILLLALPLLSCFASLHQACNRLDRDSLLSLNLSFNTSSNAPLNWSLSTDCCLWEGIICDASGHVTRLWLPWRGLSGSISPAISKLTHLSHLNLSYNHLSGPLSISSFSSSILLKTLDLSNNRLSGEFPLSLSPKYINIIDLSSNQFQGIIPSTIFQETENLISFNVSNNGFTGPIPCSAWIDSFCSVMLLDFSYNEFDGQIPLGLGNCSRLKTFRAGLNYLSGSLPDDIYAATSLEELSLPVNYLSGYISNSITNLTSLRILELYSNQFTGLIPQDIGKLTNLKSLLLNRNYLSGSLPPPLKNCSNLTTLNLRLNFFEGDISAFNFSTLLNLRMLALGSNLFTGNLPLTLNSCKSLTALSLSSNQLVGQISPSIVALQSLSFLSVSNNSLTNITGAIRILMGFKNLKILIISKNFIHETMPDNDQITLEDGFQNLQILALGNCKLKGQIPSWLSKLRKLQVLDLSLNQLTGSVPGCLGNQPSLFYIDLSDNLISGKFLKELCRLPALRSKQDKNQVKGSQLEFPLFVRRENVTNRQYNQLFNLPPAIYLRNNSLSGSIPIEIGRLKLLHVLDLGQNNFSGNIPNQISQLVNLERLDLSRNNLSGELPGALRGLHFLSYLCVAYNSLQGPIPSGGQFDTFPSSCFEGNPGLCGITVKRPCDIQPRTNSNLGFPEKSSGNEELGYGLIAGAVFGFIIGSVSGILYPLSRLKFLQHLRYPRWH